MFLIPLLFIGSNAFIGDEGWVSLLIAIPFTFFVYVIPAFFSLFYLAFGASFILIRWVDNFLVFLIYHYVSNITPIFIIFMTWYFASAFLSTE